MVYLVSDCADSLLSSPSSRPTRAAFVSFQGHQFITAFLENRGTEKSNFTLYVAPAQRAPDGGDSEGSRGGSAALPAPFHWCACPAPWSCGSRGWRRAAGGGPCGAPRSVATGGTHRGERA